VPFSSFSVVLILFIYLFIIVTLYGAQSVLTRQPRKSLTFSHSSPSLDASGRGLALKLRATPGTKIRGSVNYFVLFYGACSFYVDVPGCIAMFQISLTDSNSASGGECRMMTMEPTMHRRHPSIPNRCSFSWRMTCARTALHNPPHAHIQSV
jgi:hypothetical protein